MNWFIKMLIQVNILKQNSYIHFMTGTVCTIKSKCTAEYLLPAYNLISECLNCFKSILYFSNADSAGNETA